MIHNILTVLAFISATLLLFGLLSLFKPTKKNVDDGAKRIIPFPLIRGDGGAPKSTPKAEVPNGPKVYKRDIPAKRISVKKVEFVSRKGKKLRAKFSLTEDGCAAIRRRGMKFIRKLAA